MLQQASEILIQRASAGVAYVGGMMGVVLANFEHFIATNFTAAVSVAALLINWYYNRRKDRREERYLEIAESKEGSN